MLKSKRITSCSHQKKRVVGNHFESLGVLEISLGVADGTLSMNCRSDHILQIRFSSHILTNTQHSNQSECLKCTLRKNKL